MSVMVDDQWMMSHHRHETAGSEVRMLDASFVTRRTCGEAKAGRLETSPAMKVEVSRYAAAHRRGDRREFVTEVSRLRRRYSLC